MKVFLETRDPKIQAELEQWYHEKGWIWSLDRGKALVRGHSYNVSFCFGLEPTPNSMSHSLTLAPITSG
jgi:hypothetical protein